MALDSRIRRIQSVYDAFEKEAAPYTAHAVCTPGCAFCCTHFGTVDMTTLEGMVIMDALEGLPKTRRMRLLKQIDRNRRKKLRGETDTCPFLQKNRRCIIYDVRPFSCRQLYSLTICGEQGPTVHRQSTAISRQTVLALQALDDTGYSGHISAILGLLQDKGFRAVYTAGDFRPEAIQAFGRAHRLVINASVTGVGKDASRASA